MTIRNLLIAAVLACSVALGACAHGGAPPTKKPTPSEQGLMPRMPVNEEPSAKPADDSDLNGELQDIEIIIEPPVIGPGTDPEAKDAKEFDETEGVDSTSLIRTHVLIKSMYVEAMDVKFQDLFYGMIKGMVESLDDPYSVFLNPTEAKMFRDDMKGSFAGIGATLAVKDGRVTVMGTMPDSPSAKAGLKKGDLILEVDGQKAIDQPLEKVVPRIRGEAGTTVVIKIVRPGEGKPRDVRVVRAEIKSPPTVQTKMVKQGKKSFMVIALSGFQMETEQLFDEAAREALAAKVDGVVIDLRDNPGGLLHVASEVICHWQKGKPTAIEVRLGGVKVPVECGPTSPILANMPTAILVNGSSASASEIMAGALQDYGKARIIGEKTFGKGCGQSVLPYPDGSLLRLTTFYWLTPNERVINKIGVEPDDKVVANPDDLEKGKDVQMERALKFLSTGK